MDQYAGLYAARDLVAKHPYAALDKIRECDDVTLSDIFEAVSHTENPALVLEAVLALASHPKAYVREGAAYGLTTHRDNPMVKHALLRAAMYDESKTIREIAADAANYDND
jgi:HEAT repeat protein